MSKRRRLPPLPPDTAGRFARLLRLSQAIPKLTPYFEWRAALTACQMCHLRAQCRQVVPDRWARPAPTANIMYIAEAPGEQEDKLGQVLVGPAGRLTSSMIQQAGLPEPDVVFGNVLHCRPSANIFDAEAAAICVDWLFVQMRIVRPRVVILAGKKAIQYVLYGGVEPEAPMKALVGNAVCRRVRWPDTFAFVPMYHPSYILRQGSPTALIQEQVAILRNIPRILTQGYAALDLDQQDHPLSIPISKQGELFG